MTDRIEKTVDLKAPVSRVWKALTDHKEFGTWFRVSLDGPFVPGARSTGHITYPGYDHLKWEAVVQKVEPERLFSFTWHPYAVEPGTDYSQETPTLVELPDAGNVRMLGNLLGDPKQEVRIGADVQAVFEPHDDAKPPFTLVQWKLI